MKHKYIYIYIYIYIFLYIIHVLSHGDHIKYTHDDSIYDHLKRKHYVSIAYSVDIFGGGGGGGKSRRSAPIAIRGSFCYFFSQDKGPFSLVSGILLLFSPYGEPFSVLPTWQL